jgi:hypothetical protein
VVWAAFALGLLSITVCHDIYATPFVGEHIHKFAADAVRAYLTSEKNEDAKAADNAVRFGLSALASIPLSVLLALALNVPLRSSQSLCADLLFRVSSVSELECFLWDVTNRAQSVMVTLSNGKVYIGNSIEMPKPGEAKTWIRLEPLLSGYRDQEHKFKPVTSYLWVHRQTKGIATSDASYAIEDFDVYLPIDSIQSVHPFDIELYETGFKPDSTTEPAEALAAPLAANHRAKIRPARLKKVTREEWIYSAYVSFIVVIPFLFFFRLPITATGIVILCFMIARTFIAGARMKEQQIESQQSRSGASPVMKDMKA